MKIVPLKSLFKALGSYISVVRQWSLPLAFFSPSEAGDDKKSSFSCQYWPRVFTKRWKRNNHTKDRPRPCRGMVCWQNTAFSKQHYQDLHAASRKEIQDLDEEAGPLPLGQQAVDCKNGRTSLFQHEWFTNTVPEMLAKRSVRGCPSWSRSRCSSSNIIIISSSGRRHSTRPSLSLSLDVGFSHSLGSSWRHAVRGHRDLAANAQPLRWWWVPSRGSCPQSVFFRT